MEEVKKKISDILDRFLQEEVGNRLSQFAMLALKSIILDELNKADAKQDSLKGQILDALKKAKTEKDGV